MDKNEKYIARVLFKMKAMQSDGQAFEDLFCRVFENGNPNFRKVKPQGAYGDRKNDGYDASTGKYYQVYAPEDLPSSEDTAAAKLEADFNGLKSYWNQNGMGIKEFHYVINDKYKGVYPTICSAIDKLSKQNRKIKIHLLRANNLEDVFINQTDSQILDIVGSIPDPTIINDVDYQILTEVVNHIMKFEIPDLEEEIPQNPDFDKKIEFNGISNRVSRILEVARQQTYVVTDFFGMNSSFAKDELRDRFQNLYQEARQLYGNEKGASDQVFFHIRNKSSPADTKSYYDAVYVLMAHYFEFCDIFEPVQ